MSSLVNMKIGIIVQARMISVRLPGKVMYELAGLPILDIIIERLKRARSSDIIILATGDKQENKPILDTAKRFGIGSFEGSESDVLLRFANAAKEFGLDAIVRVTADCPLVDPEIVDQMVEIFISGKYDYVTNVKPPTWPDGLDISVFTREILERANREALLFSERQHVVIWMWKKIFDNPTSEFSGINVPASSNLSFHRWVIDEMDDYIFFQRLVEFLGRDKIITAGWQDILCIINKHPDICLINQRIIRDAGLAQDLLKDGKSEEREGMA